MKVDWNTLLQDLSKELLRDKDINYILERQNRLVDVRDQTWLGYEPALENDLKQLEKKLQITLPNTYREFLSVTNGWGPINTFIYRLLSVSEVDWYRNTDPGSIQAWIKGEGEGANFIRPDEIYLVYGDEQDPCSIRSQYLSQCLKISALGDSAEILLNPVIKTPEGEWEAWFFASWLAGAQRYRSFYELMQAQLKTARDYQPDDELQSVPRPGFTSPGDEL